MTDANDIELVRGALECYTNLTKSHKAKQTDPTSFVVEAVITSQSKNALEALQRITEARGEAVNEGLVELLQLIRIKCEMRWQADDFATETELAMTATAHLREIKSYVEKALQASANFPTAREIRNEALEEAACLYDSGHHVGQTIAKTIRALKGKA